MKPRWLPPRPVRRRAVAVTLARYGPAHVLTSRGSAEHRVGPVSTGFREIDAALDGGLQPGSFTLILT